jgi:hypothetical protein
MDRFVPVSTRDFARVIHKSRPFQDVPPLAPLPPDVYGIVGLSDSFGDVGTLTSTNYHDYLQRRFQLDGYRHSQVINVSVPGYDTPEEVVYLPKYALKYKPKVLLHGFFVGNDTDMCDGTFCTLPGSFMTHVPDFQLLSPKTWAITQWFHDLEWVAEQRRQLPPGGAEWWKLSKLPDHVIPGDHLDPVGQPPEPDENPSYGMPVSRFSRILEAYSAHYLPGYVSSRAWWGVRANLVRMFRASREAGAQHVIVLFPDQLQIDEDLQKNFLRNPRHANRPYDFTQPQRLVAELARENGVPVIDLYPAFKSFARGGSLYLKRNTHWNSRGNWLAAKEIYEGLVRLSLLGPHDPPATNLAQSTH